jgi:PASTA domain-containing protein
VAARLTSMLPRVVALTAILVLASATLSFAADNVISSPATPVEATVAPPALVTVPDVRGQAYVFAKGTLEEQGFAWRVAGAVKGYAANTVATQTPAPGSRVIDTGLPTILLGLERNAGYPEAGDPENASPYDGTAIKFLRPRVAPKAKLKPAAKPMPAAKPKARPKSKAKPAAKPKTRAKAKPKPRPKAKAKPKVPAARPPAFTTAGAPKEPLDELALPVRAARLESWLAAHPKPTNANVRHWLYQHEWIVTGAKFGWWHGAEALEILVRVDEKIQRRWGIGAKSEAAARSALAAVRAKSR